MTPGNAGSEQFERSAVWLAVKILIEGGAKDLAVPGNVREQGH